MTLNRNQTMLLTHLFLNIYLTMLFYLHLLNMEMLIRYYGESYLNR